MTLGLRKNKGEALKFNRCFPPTAMPGTLRRKNMKTQLFSTVRPH